MALSFARHDALFPLETLGIAPALIAWARLFCLAARCAPAGRAARRGAAGARPGFIKLGQVLSTRSDLLGEEVAADLAQLQDQLPPFPAHRGAGTIEAELGQPIEALFCELRRHAGLRRLDRAGAFRRSRPTAGAVAVKVLRPGIEPAFARDLDLFSWIAELVERTQPRFRRLQARSSR